MYHHETKRIDGVFAALTTDAQHAIAAFDTQRVPPYSIDYWGYQERQTRVVIDGEGRAFLLRNFGDPSYYAADVAREHGGYTDVVLGQAEIERWGITTHGVRKGPQRRDMMLRQRYRLSTYADDTPVLYVFCYSHRMRIWNQTRLVGVSARTERRIRKVFGDLPIFCDATPYRPLVVGFDRN